MADALVSIALEKLTDVLLQQLELFAGATDELQKIQQSLRHIKAVLHDAENKQVTQESVRLWLSELRQVAYDIADLIDERLENDGSDGDAGNGECAAGACLPSPFTCFHRGVSRYLLGSSVHKIRERLDQIARDKEQFSTREISSSSENTRPVSSSRMKEGMMGRYDDETAVLSRLLGKSSSTSDVDGQRQRLVGASSSKQQQQLVGASSSSGDKDWRQQQQLVGASSSTGDEDGQQQQQEEEAVQVIAILGIGGRGKTTLARKIYSHSSVQGHFEKALYWVGVSEDFDEKRLTKAIIEQVKGQSTSLSEPEALQNELVAALGGKRFLLVLDDVWNVDESKWNTLQPCLASGAPGSRILVTTRLQVVAERTMKAAYILHLKGLPDTDSWRLFRRIALDGRDAREYQQLESVGREIVSNCNGVPLSLTVMGSLMSFKRTVEDWQSILDSNMWSFPEVENGILPALWLSYHNLPSHLKQCFVYCSIYQKGSVMSKDELVRLWIAQGFIRPQGNRLIETIGGEYVDDLVAWSMLQQVGKNSRGEIISCKMHDLLHDLARFIAKDEIYSTIISKKDEQSGQSPSNNVRHKCMYFTDNDDKPNTIPIVFGTVKKLRTIWLYRVDGFGDVTVDFLLEAQLLRALVLRGSMPSEFSDSKIVKLPNAIGKMKHLRYLDVSGLNIEELPEAVSHLRNLHTLNLTRCRQLKKLPTGIGEMASLRHLEIKETDSLQYLPRGLGKLSHLRSLCKFIVGGGGGGGGCSIDELQQLNSLQESLEIEHLERVTITAAAREAQLLRKQHLHRLVLRTLGRDDAENERTKSVVEGRLPHENLEKLLEGLWPRGKLVEELEGLRAPWNLEEVFEGLRPHDNLGELELCRYTGSKLPSWIDKMACLQTLQLRICPKLKGLLHHHANAPLTQLMIEDCDAIEGLSGSSFGSLENLTLINCSKFFSNGLPDLPCLQTLEIIISKNTMLPNGGWEQLETLHKLKIRHCNELQSLPDGLMQVSTLEYLHISCCDKLKLLPESLGKLRKLDYFEIWQCRALRSLPEEFRRCGLQGLSIDGCPLLSERCKMEGGEDWPKISHIPYISINGKWIQK